MAEKKKGLISKLFENLDKNLEKKSKNKKCCCCQDSEDKQC